MENLKLPVALVAAMGAQLAGGVWWVSQQASTISSLEETVSQLGSRMAIEDNVNLKRDVKSNAGEIEDIWDDLSGMMMSISQINSIKQRIALLENDLKYINRDHNGMMNMKGK
jgi:enoyl-[acyl-carrier-protein] reductase (NADH)